MDDPGANLRGTVTLSSTASDAGSGIASRVYEYSPAGAGSWSSTRPPSTRPASRTGSTTSASSSPTSPATRPPRRRSQTGASTTPLRRASIDDPGANLRGTVTLTSSASDAGSGDRPRAYQHSPAGRRHLDDDPGRLRHDRCLGRALRPARHRHRRRRQLRPPRRTVANRRVDNTAPSASLTLLPTGASSPRPSPSPPNSSDPGGSGVDSVTFERRPAGGGSWTAIDTDTSSPYSVSWDTSALADG